jgi:DNA-binding transcriptional LysR family regulator
MNSEAICRAVVNGELELGVVTLPLQAIAHLQTKVLWPDPLEFVIGRGHALLKSLSRSKQRAGNMSFSARQLSDIPAILPAHGTFTRDIVEHAFDRQRAAIRTGLTTNYLETIKMLVGVGMGWSVLPLTMLDKDLIAIKVNQLQLHRDLGVVWHAQHTLSNAAREMCALLTTYSAADQ